MVEENISQKFSLKSIDETRNYVLKEIEQNDLIRRKYKKLCIALNFIENFLILACTINGCISISAFASLIVIPLEIKSSPIGLKNLCHKCRN